jgi:CRISPR-associated endonuclease/helicase Cas3
VDSVLGYWGKATLEQSQSYGTDAAWHPVAYHSLDVAATVSAYLDVNPSILGRLAALLHLGTPETRAVAVFAAAGHDLGKFGMGFQSKAPEVFSKLFPGQPRMVEDGSHSAVGLLTLLQFLCQTWYPDVDEEVAGVCLEPLANAACGHHGRPEKLTGGTALVGPALAAATSFLHQVAALSGMQRPPAAYSGATPEDAETALCVAMPQIQEGSWLLAGVITLCDWVGSSKEFFPYEHPTLSLDKYWTLAIEKAQAAVEACGLVEKSASIACGFDWLYGTQRAHDEPGFRALSPTPLQSWADTVVLPAIPRPTLFVLEDETGAGKTEAAMTLASRLTSNGFGRGVMFSLPTQTTANAVFARVQPVVSRFFAPGSMPTVSLVHGNAKMALARMKSSQAAAGTVTSDLDSWSRESAKTALLADFGVGTVDQVALAGLPVRHVVLRHLGLAQKILIIDEAHACEPYMLDILKNALTQHARLGGSAIILSATLPRAMKQGLVDAFARGTRPAAAPSNSGVLTHTAYPLATAFWPGSLVEQAITACKVPRTLRFEPVRPLQVPVLVGGWLDAGKSVCLLRNTVAVAQAAYEYYETLYPGQVTLVHARFVQCHRGDNDQALLASFGKESTHSFRAGRLVIATQVAEQSLDVDFDEMVTDLAPLDSLLQREGRRRRHIRDACGNPSETEGREPSPLYVITPSVADNTQFMTELSPGTAFVYPLPGVLYRTADVIHNWKSIQVPSQVREAVEFAYDESAPVPEFLSDAEDASSGKIYAAQQHARVRKLHLDEGYSCHANIELSENSVTRLGEPSVQVVICNAVGRPLFGGGGAFDSGLSQLSLRAGLLGIPRSEDGKMWLRMANAGLDSWSASVQDPRGRKFTAHYRRATGFSLVAK